VSRHRFVFKYLKMIFSCGGISWTMFFARVVAVHDLIMVLNGNRPLTIPAVTIFINCLLPLQTGCPSSTLSCSSLSCKIACSSCIPTSSPGPFRSLSTLLSASAFSCPKVRIVAVQIITFVAVHRFVGPSRGLCHLPPLVQAAVNVLPASVRDVLQRPVLCALCSQQGSEKKKRGGRGNLSF